MTRVWGRRGSPLGQVRHQPCESYAEGLNRVQQLQQRRARRGYARVGAVPLDTPVQWAWVVLESKAEKKNENQ